MTNVDQACVAEPSCLAADTTTQDQTLFVECVDPNTVVHQVIANQIGAADAIGMQGQLALLVTEGFDERMLFWSEGGQGAVASHAGRRVSCCWRPSSKAGQAGPEPPPRWHPAAKRWLDPLGTTIVSP